MGSGKESKTGGKSTSGRRDKLEVIKVLVLAVVSFAAGFALVFFFLRPPTSSSEPEASPAGQQLEVAARAPDASAGGYAPADPGGDPSGGGYAPGGGETEGEEAAAHEGDRPPEVPPGKTPDGVVLDGDAFYLKCWNSDGKELAGEQCDRLRILEKRMSTRLYVVDECRKQKAGDAGGKLSLACEVDFDNTTISFWSGPSSEIENAAQIGTCVRDELQGLPLHGVDHDQARYRMFFTVLFGKPAQKAEKREEEIADKYGKGRMVDVTKDHVRVRRSPVDGAVIGKISSGNQVRLLEQEEGWCQVITPNKNKGWMICSALDL